MRCNSSGLINIPAEVRELPEGLGTSGTTKLANGTIQGKNRTGARGYARPWRPAPGRIITTFSSWIPSSMCRPTPHVPKSSKALMATSSKKARWWAVSAGKNSEPPDPKIVAALPSPKCTESQSVHSDAMKLCLWGSVVRGGTPRYCPSNSHDKLLTFINLTLTVAFF